MEGKVTPSSWDVFFNEHDICVAGFFCSFYLDLADFSWQKDGVNVGKYAMHGDF